MSLRAGAAVGMAWLSSSTGLTVMINVAQTIVLARLLPTRDFGLMTMVWVVAGFAQMFADVGVSNAVIQRRDVTSKELSSVYWLNVLAASAIAFVVWLSAPLLAIYYREPDVAGLVPWVAATLVVMGLGQQFGMLMQRELLFRSLAIGDVLASLAGFVVAITSARLQAGAFALVFGGLAAATARTIWLGAIMWRTWHPVFHFRAADLRGFMRFGLFQIGDRISNYVWSNADYILIGRFLGSSALGIYRLAYETVVRPLSSVNPILNTIAYPIFARHQHDDAKLRRGFIEMVRLMATIVCPLLAGLIVIAPVAVPIVFGSRWTAATVIIQILAPLGVLRSLLNTPVSVLLAKGLVNRVFYLNLSLAIVLPIGYWLVADLGLRALAWTAVILLGAVMAVWWKPFCLDPLGLQWTTYLRAISSPLILSGVMATGVGALVFGTAHLHTMPLLRLVSLVISGGILYGALLWMFDREYLDTLRGYVPGRG